MALAGYSYKGFIIRERDRRCASPKEGMRQAWVETQVVQGRKIIARFDFTDQAERWIDARLKDEGAQ